MDKYIKPLQQATNLLLLPPELFADIGETKRHNVAQSETGPATILITGGRITLKKVTETAHLSGQHFSE